MSPLKPVDMSHPRIPHELAELQLSARVDSHLHLFVSVLNRSSEPGFLKNVYRETYTWFNAPQPQPGPTRSAARVDWMGNDSALLVQGPEPREFSPVPTYMSPPSPSESLVGPGERSEYEIVLPLPLTEWGPYYGKTFVTPSFDDILVWPDGQRTPAWPAPVPVRRIHFRLQAKFGNVPVQRMDGYPWVVSSGMGGMRGVLAASVELPSPIPMRYAGASRLDEMRAHAEYAAELENPREGIPEWVPRPGFTAPPGPPSPVRVEKP